MGDVVAQGDDKGYQVCKKKMDTSAEKLCEPEWPDAFSRFLESVLALKYDEEPKYEAYMALFRPLTGEAASRPITISPAADTPPKKVVTPGSTNPCTEPSRSNDACGDMRLIMTQQD